MVAHPHLTVSRRRRGLAALAGAQLSEFAGGEWIGGTRSTRETRLVDSPSTLANPHCTVPFCKAPPRSGNTRKFSPCSHPAPRAFPHSYTTHAETFILRVFTLERTPSDPRVRNYYQSHQQLVCGHPFIFRILMSVYISLTDGS